MRFEDSAQMLPVLEHSHLILTLSVSGVKLFLELGCGSPTPSAPQPRLRREPTLPQNLAGGRHG
jgi:hypothetical protein